MIKIKSFDNVNDIHSEKKINPKRSKKNVHRNLPNRGVKIVKNNNTTTTTPTAIDICSDDDDNSSSDYHSNSSLTTFITADKFDLLIIKELLKDPSITTLEISLKSGIPFSITHKKRRLIESKVLKKKRILDFRVLGLNFRYADVFANIKEDKINYLVNQLHTTSFTKNIIKVMRVKGEVNGICIKTLYQDSEELFFFMDKLRSYSFVSNVYFSEIIEVLGDNTVNIILNLLSKNS